MGTRERYQKQLCQRVAKARDRLEKSQREMAGLLGVETNTYAKWENRSPMPHYHLVRFCGITGSDPGQMLTGDKRPRLVDIPHSKKSDPS